MTTLKSLLVIVLAGLMTVRFAVAQPSDNLARPIGLLKQIIPMLALIFEAKEIADKVKDGAEIVGPTDIDFSELDQVIRRSQTYSPRVPPTPPGVGANRYFSPDKDVRARAAEELADFVITDRKEIAFLRERLTAHREHSDLYKRRWEASRRYQSVLEELSRDQRSSGLAGYEAAKAWVTVVAEIQPRLAAISSNYERITREFEQLIRQREASNADQVRILNVIHVIQGTAAPKEIVETGSVEKPDFGSPKNQPLQGSAIDKQIGGAVGDGQSVKREGDAARKGIAEARRQGDRAERQAAARRYQSNSQNSGAPDMQRPRAGGSGGRLGPGDDAADFNIDAEVDPKTGKVR